jgi:prophage regulatory protein
MPSNDNWPLVSLNDAAKMTSMSRTMLNKLRGRGDFPQAVPLGERRVAFVRQEVMTWIDARVAAREHRVAA